MENSKRIHIWSWIIIRKLAGAGFAMAALAMFFLYTSGFNLYQFSEVISGSVWAIFYGYGIICSLLIHLLSHWFRGISTWLKILLYIVAGYLFFIALDLFFTRELSMLTIITGTIGALCALIFYAGFIVSNKSRVFTFIFTIIVPLLLLFAHNADLTVKRGWQEASTNDSFEASFDYFNGKHEIPFELHKGETVAFSVSVNNHDGGGHGYHVTSQHTNKVPMPKVNAGSHTFQASESGIYRIVVTGNNLQGSIKVSWKKI